MSIHGFRVSKIGKSYVGRYLLGLLDLFRIPMNKQLQESVSYGNLFRNPTIFSERQN